MNHAAGQQLAAFVDEATMRGNGTNESGLVRTETRILGGGTLETTNYISPRRLKLWLKCPLAYKLHYIDGLVTPTTPSLFLGQVVHRGLQYYYRHRQRGVTLLPRHLHGQNQLHAP